MTTRFAPHIGIHKVLGNPRPNLPGMPVCRQRCNLLLQLCQARLLASRLHRFIISTHSSIALIRRGMQG